MNPRSIPIQPSKKIAFHSLCIGDLFPEKFTEGGTFDGNAA